MEKYKVINIQHHGCPIRTRFKILVWNDEFKSYEDHVYNFLPTTIHGRILKTEKGILRRLCKDGRLEL